MRHGASPVPLPFLDGAVRSVMRPPERTITRGPSPVPPDAPGSAAACAHSPGLRFAFIGGARKSGTTWLLRLLAAHPQLLAMGEGFFIGTAGWGLSPAIDERVFRNWAALDDVAGSWMRGSTADEGLRVATRGMIEALMRSAAARSRKPGFRVLIDKSAYAYSRFAGRLHEVFPEASFIDIVRDGRDAAVSDVFMILAKSLGTHFPEENRRHIERARAYLIEGRGEPVPLFNEWLLRRSAREWAEAITGSAVAAECFGPRYVRFRYEDLLADPSQIHLALTMLGVDDSDAAVAACVNAGAFRSLSGGREPGQEDRAHFFRKGVAGDWRNHFGEEDKRCFKEEAGRALVELGYETGDDW